MTATGSRTAPTRRIEFGLEVGMHHAAEVIEVPGETTDEELDQMLDVFVSNHVTTYWTDLP